MAESASNKTQLSVDKSCRDIGKLAVWSVTSAKPGNGVELLCDDRDDTYWQSDGSQPHLINIQFQKKVRLQSLAVYLDYKLDESYTPNKVSVSAGTSYDDLRPIKTVEMEEPTGWVNIPLQVPELSEPLKAYFVQLAVISNHQNGRDTHIRQVKVFGPRQDTVQRLMAHDVGFVSPEFLMFSVVR
ncbi:hypothetical protein WJX77_001987 [Trebouxia sp. C0004]